MKTNLQKLYNTKIPTLLFILIIFNKFLKNNRFTRILN